MKGRSLVDAVVPFVFLAYSLFLFGFFLFPKMPEHYEYYYWSVLPAAALLVPCGYVLLKHSRLFWFVLAYLAYMFASSVWSEPFNASEILFGGRLMLYVLSFLLVSVVLLHEAPEPFEAMLKVTCALSAVMAVASITVFYADNPFPRGRLHGLGRMEYVVRTSYIFGFFGILALYYWTHERSPVLRIGYAVIVGVLLVAVVLTQSRAALAAMFLAAFVLGLSENRKWALMFVLGSAALAGLVWLSLPDLASEFTSRGLPNRPAIWLHWLSQTWETSPVFGHGLMTRWPLVSPSLPFRETHNAFIGTFRDGGIIGLGLLVASVVYAFVAAVRLTRAHGAHRFLALMIYLLVCILANDDRLLIRPQELWVYFWLPLAFIMAGEAREATQAGSSELLREDRLKAYSTSRTNTET